MKIYHIIFTSIFFVLSLTTGQIPKKFQREEIPVQSNTRQTDKKTAIINKIKNPTNKKSNTTSVKQSQPQKNDNNINHDYELQLMSSYEFGLSLGILVFGLLLVLLEVYIINKNKLGEEVLVKFILITLIITGTLFLITAGYSDIQIASAMGLFGTVAGYLLGRSATK